MLEYIQDQVFYHIQKANLSGQSFQLGQTYFIGEEKNPFIKFYDNFPARKHFDGTPEKTLDLLSEYFIFTRETIFEEIRWKYFPHLPSRQHCIWLIPKTQNPLEHLAYWIQKLCSNRENYQILELKCSGKIIYLNEKFIVGIPHNLNELRQLAFKYWSGTDADKNISGIECLFEGFIKVESLSAGPIKQQK